MTTPHSNPEAFWNHIFDNFQKFVEAKQNAAGIDPWDKDPDYIWKPQRQDRGGGRHGVPEDDAGAHNLLRLVAMEAASRTSIPCSRHTSNLDLVSLVAASDPGILAMLSGEALPGTTIPSNRGESSPRRLY